MASLCVFPQRFLYSIGLGGAVVALMSALVVVTVLPALLGLLGHRIDSLVPIGLDGRPSGRRWYQWGLRVTRHPIPFAVGAAALMLAAAIPFFRVELTRADASVLPESSSANAVQRAIANDFARDPAARLVMVIGPGATRAQAEGAAQQLTRTTGISLVSTPQAAGDGLQRVDAALSVRVYSGTAEAAVRKARTLNWGAPVLVTGPTAELIDERKSIGAHLPLMALLMNGLTVSAAFGILVVVFGDGFLSGLLGFTAQGALDISIPVLLFALVFGLSTDYGVFLLQRIADLRRPRGSEREAIARGLARSGRQITSAAILFSIAFGTFVLSDLVFVKELALGASLAVLLDAAVVRAMLFPALLRLADRRAWWGPLPPRSRERPRQDDPLAIPPVKRR